MLCHRIGLSVEECVQGLRKSAPANVSVAKDPGEERGQTLSDLATPNEALAMACFVCLSNTAVVLD